MMGQAVETNAIRLVVFDVDGVLTDGSIIIDDRGIESKRFHVHDGFAIRAAMSIGIHVAILTGRSSRAVTHRARELGMTLLVQGHKNKGIGLETLCQRVGVEMEESAFVGDDLNDLPALLRCGYPIAVADAVAEVREVARYVTTAAGGAGAAREAVEHLLKRDGRWEEVMERFGI